MQPVEQQALREPHPLAEPEALKTIYSAQLEAAAAPGGGDSHHGSKTFRAMLRAASALPARRLAAVGDVWLWSDLHFGHANIIRYTKRPFASAEEMDARLYENWAATVGAEDTVVFVGDVAMRQAVGEHTWQRIRAAPGIAKHLVFGNHDLTASGGLRVAGFNDICAVLSIDGDPPLLCTHMPLHDVPAGCVNVHGHTHDEKPRRSAHINVSVEQLEYRPVALDAVRSLAKELVAERYPQGATTLERIRSLRASDGAASDGTSNGAASSGGALA